MIVFRLVSFLVIIFALLVLGRFVQAKYLSGDKNATLSGAIEQTKKYLLGQGEQINQQLGQVLGKSDKSGGLAAYMREDLPPQIKEQIEKSKIVGQVQQEVNKIVQDTTQKVKDLPEAGIKKIKKDVSQEICRQLLKEDDQATGGGTIK